MAGNVVPSDADEDRSTSTTRRKTGCLRTRQATALKQQNATEEGATQHSVQYGRTAAENALLSKGTSASKAPEINCKLEWFKTNLLLLAGHHQPACMPRRTARKIKGSCKLQNRGPCNNKTGVAMMAGLSSDSPWLGLLPAIHTALQFDCNQAVLGRDPISRRKELPSSVTHLSQCVCQPIGNLLKRRAALGEEGVQLPQTHPTTNQPSPPTNCERPCRSRGPYHSLS